MEIERKFRVIEANLPDLTKKNKIRIDQHYIFLGKEGEVRIRRKGNKHFITIKSNGTVVRHEREAIISPKAYKTLVPAAIGRTVSKERYSIKLTSGEIAELDVYVGKLQGLKTVEVEFKTVKDAISFIPPNWFGEDITEGLKNKDLAVNENIKILEGVDD